MSSSFKLRFLDSNLAALSTLKFTLQKKINQIFLTSKGAKCHVLCNRLIWNANKNVAVILFPCDSVPTQSYIYWVWLLFQWVTRDPNYMLSPCWDPLGGSFLSIRGEAGYSLPTPHLLPSLLPAHSCRLVTYQTAGVSWESPWPRKGSSLCEFFIFFIGKFPVIVFLPLPSDLLNLFPCHSYQLKFRMSFSSHTDVLVPFAF